MTKTNSFYGTGRRKNAIARVWIFPGQTGFTINGNTPQFYLQRANLEMIVGQPLKTAALSEQFRIRAEVSGGGTAGQAGAIRLGIARALMGYDAKLRTPLRAAGLVTRDPRKKERKKPGRKGARRSFQYTKR